MEDLELIYRTYFQDVYYYVLSLSSKPELAEDITSETFVKAMKGLHTFKGDCELRVWLCQIAKNCYIDYVRKHKRLTPVEHLDVLPSQEAVEKSYESKEQYLRVLELVTKLKEPYHRVFKLRYLEERSFKEIAEEYERTENWACVVSYRAKEMIKKWMEEYNEDIL